MTSAGQDAKAAPRTRATPAPKTKLAAPLKRGRKRSPVEKLDIVRHAAALFDRHGYDQAKMQQIATGLGISKPTLYNYYNGKAAILQAIFDNVIEGADAILDEAEQSTDGTQALHVFVQRSLQFGALNRAMMNVFMSGERSLPANERQRQRQWSRKAYRRLLQLVSNAQPTNGGIDARIVTFAITAFINQVGVWFSQKGDLSLPEVADGYCALLDGGLLNGNSRRAESD